ncbi:MAG: hypothetical protein V2A79_10190 [Planctomycetota bacterium]
MKQYLEMGADYLHVGQEDERSSGIVFARLAGGGISIGMTDGNESIDLDRETWNKVVAKMQEQKHDV